MGEILAVIDIVGKATTSTLDDDKELYKYFPLCTRTLGQEPHTGECRSSDFRGRYYIALGSEC